ncbi:MAG: transglycosylase family protein [Paenisporosarcina sp.]
MKQLLLIFFLVSLTGCTYAELMGWKEWHERDPVAAVEFANLPEVQAEFANATERAVRLGPVGPPSTDPPPVVWTVWDRLAECESGGNWSYNGSSGYDGGLQFLPSTWVANGGRDFAEYAWQATREEQIIVAERLRAIVGWSAWPACSRKLGLR